MVGPLDAITGHSRQNTPIGDNFRIISIHFIKISFRSLNAFTTRTFFSSTTRWTEGQRRKNLENCNRWRNKTVTFRVSPEEDKQIETAVRLSGLTKQDYITRRLLCQDVVVQGNPRVYKALRNELAAVLTELQRIEAGGSVDNELLDTIELIAVILGGLKGEGEDGE